MVKWQTQTTAFAIRVYFLVPKRRHGRRKAWGKHRYAKGLPCLDGEIIDAD